ncbi:MAG: methyltransferase domain-containing protein [Chloroflexia bacterium]
MTTQPAFDPEQFKETTREQWDTVAEAWDRWTPTLQIWLGPVTTAMLDLAQLRPGDRVLDAAAGAGEPGPSAAEQIGPTGSILSTDFAANILAFAQRAARARKITNFATRVMDAENLDLPDASFDAAFSRLGIIYCPDRAKALAEMRRVLKPGGRAVVASFTTPDQNRFMSGPIGIIRRRAQLPPPPPGLPSPFSLGAPGVMETMLQQAGFRSVATRTIDSPLNLTSAAECTRFERESFGALTQMLAAQSPEARAAAWEEVAQQLEQFEGPNGFEAPTQIIVGVGQR